MELEPVCTNPGSAKEKGCTVTSPASQLSVEHKYSPESFAVPQAAACNLEEAEQQDAAVNHWLPKQTPVSPQTGWLTPAGPRLACAHLLLIPASAAAARFGVSRDWCHGRAAQVVPSERLWGTPKRSAPLCRSRALTGQPGCPLQHAMWKLAGETCRQSRVCHAHRWSAAVLGLGLRSRGRAHDPKVRLAQELPHPLPLQLYLGVAGAWGGHVAKGPALRHKGTCPRSSQTSVAEQGPGSPQLSPCSQVRAGGAQSCAGVGNPLLAGTSARLGFALHKDRQHLPTMGR